jgi:hypothetical protein
VHSNMKHFSHREQADCLIANGNGHWAIEERKVDSLIVTCGWACCQKRQGENCGLTSVALQARTSRIRFNLQEPWKPEIFIHTSNADESCLGGALLDTPEEHSIDI